VLIGGSLALFGLDALGGPIQVVRRTLLTGGRVRAVRGEDVPSGLLAAILRHPL
jgi:hypothetical protein